MQNNIPKRALVDIKEEYAAIYYDSNFTVDDIRLFIAHELGHIYCHKISKLKPNTKREEELFANIFALIAMVDRNYFYENNYSKYTNRATVQIVNDIKNKIGLLGNI